MKPGVVVTGVGVVTPLGLRPGDVVRRLRQGDTAAAPPSDFDARPFSCPVCAEIPQFDPAAFIPDPKTVRLMNRDGLLAAAAAHLALDDARVVAGKDYAAEEIGLFGATGLAGMRLDEVIPLIRHSAAADGTFDARRFGSEALRRVRPILSFKILSNMPICFVSIFEGIRGPNAIYNPWEGQGAHAIARGIAAIRRGEAPCALVGGCDAKAHALAFVSLEEAGVFRSWRTRGRGTVPGEGAAFLVLEDEERARCRGARVLARIAAAAFRTLNGCPRADAQRTAQAVLRDALDGVPAGLEVAVLSGEEGDGFAGQVEGHTLRDLGVRIGERLRPKEQAGNLFAAAAALQVGLAATLARECIPGTPVLAACLGHGSLQAAFRVEAVGARSR